MFFLRIVLIENAGLWYIIDKIAFSHKSIKFMLSWIIFKFKDAWVFCSWTKVSVICINYKISGTLLINNCF